MTTRDPALAERLACFRQHGMVRDPEQMLYAEGEGPWYHEQAQLGFNYRLSDVHAALGRSQLRKLDNHVARRNAVAARYREALSGIEGLELPPQPPANALHAYHLFVIHLREGAGRRLELYQRLLDNGIRTQVHYIPVYRHPYYRRTFGYEPGFCPEAERYYWGCLSIPPPLPRSLHRRPGAGHRGRARGDGRWLNRPRSRRASTLAGRRWGPPSRLT